MSNGCVCLLIIENIHVSQNIEPVVIINVLSPEGIETAKEFYEHGRKVIGIADIKSVNDSDTMLYFLYQLLISDDQEDMARHACQINDSCEVIHC